jgi:hypothetical protein
VDHAHATRSSSHIFFSITFGRRWLGISIAAIWEITLKTKEAAGRYAVRLSYATAGSTSGSRTFRKEAR